MAKAKETKVATANQFTLDNVPTLLAKVNEEIQQLKGGEGAANQTDGQLEGFGNIFDITEPARVIKAYSSVCGREKAYNEAVKEMGIGDAPEFKIGKADAARWKDDLKKQYQIVTHKEKLEKLEKMRDILKKHVSKEQQFQTDMMELNSVLGL